MAWSTSLRLRMSPRACYCSTDLTQLHKAQAEEDTMHARKLRLDAGGGPLVAIQSSVAGAEEPGPLAAVLRQLPVYKWPTTAEIVVPMGPFHRRATTRRRTSAVAWVVALAMVGAAFSSFMFIWVGQRYDHPASDRTEQELQSIEQTALSSTPLSAAARPISCMPPRARRGEPIPAARWST